MSYKLVNQMNPRMYRYNAPYAMNPIGVVIHNTANSAAARSEVAYMNRTATYVSYHVAVDDKEAVQAVPFNRNTWHAGDGVNGRGNRRMIGVEICYSKDGGINGHKSERYKKAEENAALYIAHVLRQYGWGIDRIYTHQQMSGKYCPHVMLANGEVNRFKRRVQEHLNALNSGRKSASSSEATPKRQERISNQTGSNGKYTVKSGDSLWAIASANKVTVSQLKSWNNLKSDVIHVGMELHTAEPKNIKKQDTPYFIGKWRTNRHGTQYIQARGTFTVGNKEIMTRFGSPFTSAPEGGHAQPGWSCEYHEMVRSPEGYIMVAYYHNKRLKYIPIRTWNPKTGAVGELWGELS